MAMQSEVKTCPKCRLINPPEAERCDCGYDFIKQIGGIQKPGFFSYKGREAAFITCVAVILVVAVYFVALITHSQKLEYAVAPLLLVIVMIAFTILYARRLSFIVRVLSGEIGPDGKKKKRKNQP